MPGGNSMLRIRNVLKRRSDTVAVKKDVHARVRGAEWSTVSSFLPSSSLVSARSHNTEVISSWI